MNKAASEADHKASESLTQLEAAKKTIDLLRSDGSKAAQAFDAMCHELSKSRARVDFLEELVSKAIVRPYHAGNSPYSEEEGHGFEAQPDTEESTKHDVERLRLSLQAAEARYNEARARRISSAMVKEIESNAKEREAELESELRKSRYLIEELKAKLTSREDELSSIFEENSSGQRVRELENELQSTKARFENLEARLNENETLKLELDKSNKKLARVSEQFDAAQATVVDMEAELRRLKVQSDQYRKAAEMATAMLLAGNDPNLVERTVSMDRSYISPRTQRIISSVCTDDYVEEEEELIKSKYSNMLRRVGVFWKKTYR